MFKTIIKKTAMYVLLILISYLVIGYLLHLVIFPEKKPDISTYFKPGQTFYSKTEGFRQTVVRQEDGYVYCDLQIDPFAGGPPKHIHTGFDETLEVKQGELSVWIDGKVIKIKPGDKLFVPRGTPHKPFNETADSIQMKGSIAFPEKFAFHLPQVYGIMDKDSAFDKKTSAVFQMSIFSSAGFDSYIADGPPVRVQKALSFLITPATRLLGYKSYYKEYDINQK